MYVKMYEIYNYLPVIGRAIFSFAPGIRDRTLARGLNLLNWDLG